MTSACRYLYLVGRLDLRKVEHQAAVALAPVFFPAARPPGMARVSPQWLFDGGVGNSCGAATAALRGLRDRGVLRRRADHVYELQDDPFWDWPSLGQYRQALSELSLILDPLVWRDGPMAEALRPLLAQRTAATLHPFDPELARWAAVARDLESEYGTATLADAVSAAAADPSAVDPFDPENFRALFYALVQRARRARARS